MEYVLVHRGGRGQSFVYELLYQGEGDSGESFLLGLSSMETLSYDEKKEPLKQNNEPASCPQSVAKAHPPPPGSAKKNGAKPGMTRDYPETTENDLEKDYTGSKPVASHCSHNPPLVAAASQQAMPKKGQHTPLPPIGDPTDPDSLYAYMLRFLEWMRVKNYSDRTTEHREVYLRYFIEWCEERGLSRPPEITKPILERYQRYLFHYRKKNGEPLSTRSQHTRLTPVRAYFKWLTRENYILYNPASGIDLPCLEKRLPKHVLTQPEVELIINQPDINTVFGIRDRAILETLYSTGIRRMEVIHINLYDIDADRGTLMVHQRKGKKDRMVPVGERALRWMIKYRDETRPELAMPDDNGTLFLTNLGEAFTRNRITQLVRDYVNAADTGKTGSCHLFRHTMATLMLENGADIRFIQAMLGHANVSTTQIYTQVSIRQLKEIHTATHPARMQRTHTGLITETDEATDATE